MKIKPGLYEEMSYAEYASIDAVSRGDLVPSRSWLHSRYAAMSPSEESEALDIGQAVHTAVLEPHLVDQLYYFTDLYPYNTSEGKARKRKDQETAGARKLIRGDTPKLIAAQLHKFQPCMDALLGATVELTVVWEIGGVLCKGRIDYWNPTKGLLGDIKTAKDASPRAMQRSIIQYGYHYQSAWYGIGLKQHGLLPKHYEIQAVEKEAPWGCACYRFDATTIMRAEQVMLRRCIEWRDHQAAGVWPSYPSEPMEMSLPGWAFDDNLSDMSEAA